MTIAQNNAHNIVVQYVQTPAKALATTIAKWLAMDIVIHLVMEVPKAVVWVVMEPVRGFAEAAVLLIATMLVRLPAKEPLANVTL